jgi:hypothetical protein
MKTPTLISEIDEYEIVNRLLSEGYLVEIVDYIGRTFSQKYKITQRTTEPCAQAPIVEVDDHGNIIKL